ncbi:MAG: helicase C-terminal domain-containing protein, partial [Candidatus Paceibacterota bacterium]
QFPGERNEVLKHWMRLDNAIFLSVAFEQGLNLEGPEYPMNIVAKVPFPNLGDDWIQARNKYDNYMWYSKTVAIQVQQACGRTTRTLNDNSMTYILDGSFGPLLARNKNLFQKWFLDALVIC